MRLRAPPTRSSGIIVSSPLSAQWICSCRAALSTPASRLSGGPPLSEGTHRIGNPCSSRSNDHLARRSDEYSPGEETRELAETEPANATSAERSFGPLG